MDSSMEMKICYNYRSTGYVVLKSASDFYVLIEQIPSLYSQKLLLLSFPVMNPAESSWLTMVDHVVDFSLDI